MKLKNLFLSLFLFFSISVYSKDFIVIQSTTSIANTGLLDLLASEFKNKTGISIRPIAVGTGNAIANAKRGDGDLLFVHSKKDTGWKGLDEKHIAPVKMDNMREAKQWIEENKEVSYLENNDYLTFLEPSIYENVDFKSKLYLTLKKSHFFTEITWPF